MGTRSPAVIFDRDGTLASCPKRPEDRSDASWAEFNAALPFDPLVPVVAGLLRAIRPGITRIMTSGRAEGNHPGDRHRRFQMWDWINKYDLPIDLLFMRSGGDFRRDSIVKEEILVAEILPYYEVVYAFEDRPQIVEVWKSYNIPVMAVTDPDLPFRI